MTRLPGLSLTHLASPLGPLRAAAMDTAVVLLEFADTPRADVQLQRLCTRLGVDAVERRSPVLEQLSDELAAYFAGNRQAFDVTLHHPGTALQCASWSALREIPYGKTRSYAQHATALGHARAVRAIGTCNGLNRIAILVPCHRLVTRQGTLGGYGGGLWRKQWLLDFEAGLRPGVRHHRPAARHR